MSFSDKQDPASGSEPARPALSAAGPPPIGEERELPLDPAFVDAQRLAGGILAACVAAGLLAGVMALVFALPALPALRWLLLVAWLAAAAALGALALVWPALSYRHTSYQLGAQGLRLRRGVLWRSAILVPRARVQHTDVSQGPIERLFGLATLVIHTAGTLHASVALRGLARETAFRLRDQLIDSSEDDAA